MRPRSAPGAQKKDQSLRLVHPETPLPTLKADPLALESIFGNLITNIAASSLAALRRHLEEGT